jgi:hypothetical protein
MKRISGLLLATGLAIMPIAAFAQQTAAPAATPAAQAPAAPATSTGTKAPAAKTHTAMKHKRTTHAKRTTTPTAKPAVPSHS